MHNRFSKILTLLSLALFSASAFAQDSTFSEGNLPEKPAPKQAPAEKKSEGSGLGNSVLVNQIKGGLANMLLGSKVDSLMYDDEENANIERAVESLKNNQVFVPEGEEGELSEEEKLAQEADAKLKAEEKLNQENEKSYIYLASIIYFTPQDWVVWVNDKKITPTTNKRDNELYLKSVQKDSVRLFWKLSISKWKILSGRKEEVAPQVNAENQVEVEFTLKPNQTFILSNGAVVEGRAVIALLKKKEEDKTAKSGGAKKPANLAPGK